ncbi:hypothetical protein DYY88_12020 [Leptolyngbya iicbica LK]|uniref:Uncharacterized protein n=1 Tax=Leptolyngbya iicbica LK TaxID=2294035 RepID=A0A4Q7E9D4_9CYAN|nr:hypothetical protein DYY88_12020 [Leptolyngbya sp. LK]
MMGLCCTDTLLRHASSRGVYGFCPTCRQAMPLFGDQAAPPRSSASKGLSLQTQIRMELI